jgi:hypothetical protein
LIIDARCLMTDGVPYSIRGGLMRSVTSVTSVAQATDQIARRNNALAALQQKLEETEEAAAKRQAQLLMEASDERDAAAERLAKCIAHWEGVVEQREGTITDRESIIQVADGTDATGGTDVTDVTTCHLRDPPLGAGHRLSRLRRPLERTLEGIRHEV